MDPIRFGRQVRALRRRRGWRQVDLANSAGVSRSLVSRMELGRADELTVRSLERISRALSARLDLHLTWNGEGLDRLLDADHALIVDRVAGILRSFDWAVAVEVSFNVRGERGSIDILAFRPDVGVVIVVEVKTVIPDLQAMLVVLDRKSRLGMEIAADRGWVATSSNRVLVVADGRTNRRRVAEHATVFEAAFPARSVGVKQWIRRPTARQPLSGLWFLADSTRVSARHRVAGPPRASRA